MSGLPKGWVETKLGELFNITSSKRVHQHEWKNKGVPFFRAREIKKLARKGFVDNELYISRGLFEEYRSQFGAPQPGDLMITAVGTLGECYLVKEGDEFYFKDASVIWLKRKTEADPKFLATAFLVDDVRKQIHKGGGTTVGTYTIGAAKNTVIALPPLAEQKRIVAKLESVSAKSARARADLARIDTLVTRYKQAVLTKAFSGELTRAWREKNALGRPHVKPLSSVCSSIADGDHQAPPKVSSGIPFITISAMNDGIIYLSKATRFVPKIYYEALKNSRRPKIDDILFSVTGSYGIAAVVDSDAPFVFQRHIALLRPNGDHVLTSFLVAMLRSPQLKEEADRVATGTAQKTVPLKGLRQFRVPVPSLAEQQEIVRRIEAAFEKIDRLAAEAKRALALLGKLDEAILAKAFRGDLVPQDPTDEPASVLLERIKAERAAQPKAKRGRKKA